MSATPTLRVRQPRVCGPIPSRVFFPYLSRVQTATCLHQSPIQWTQKGGGVGSSLTGGKEVRTGTIHLPPVSRLRMLGAAVTPLPSMPEWLTRRKPYCLLRVVCMGYRPRPSTTTIHISCPEHSKFVRV